MSCYAITVERFTFSILYLMPSDLVLFVQLVLSDGDNRHESIHVVLLPLRYELLRHCVSLHDLIVKDCDQASAYGSKCKNCANE